MLPPSWALPSPVATWFNGSGKMVPTLESSQDRAGTKGMHLDKLGTRVWPQTPQAATDPMWVGRFTKDRHTGLGLEFGDGCCHVPTSLVHVSRRPWHCRTISDWHEQVRGLRAADFSGKRDPHVYHPNVCVYVRFHFSFIFNFVYHQMLNVFLCSTCALW